MCNGFTRAPNDLLRDTRLSPSEKLAWLLIASVSPGYRPTIKQYCEMMPCREQKWRAIIKHLISCGMITAEFFPRGVIYTAILEQSKWTIYKRKGVEKHHPKGSEKQYPMGVENHHPLKEQIKEQDNPADAHARVLESMKIYDQWTEAMMKNYHLDYGALCRKIDEFSLDMACRNKSVCDIEEPRAYFNAWISGRMNEHNNATIKGQPNDKRRACAVQDHQPADYNGPF